MDSLTILVKLVEDQRKQMLEMTKAMKAVHTIVTEQSDEITFLQEQVNDLRRGNSVGSYVQPIVNKKRESVH